MRLQLNLVKDTKNYVNYESAEGTDFREPLHVICKMWIPKSEFMPEVTEEMLESGQVTAYHDENGDLKYLFRDKSLCNWPGEITIQICDDTTPPEAAQTSPDTPPELLYDEKGQRVSSGDPT